MNLEIGAGSLADGADIGQIMLDWADETNWMVRAHARKDYPGLGALLVQACDVSVARVGGHVVGFLARQGVDIQGLYIDRNHRGNGIGTTLLERAKADTSQLGLWLFQSNLHAHRFYAAQGFAVDRMSDGRGNDEKLADVHMVWEGGANE